MQFTPKVMIVDDVQMIRRALKISLLKAGVTGVTEAKNGAEAIELLKQEKFDLIICDWEMPNMSGLELLQKIRSDGRLKNIAFLMATAVTDTENVTKAIQAGVTDYVTKPFQPDILCKKLVTTYAKSRKQPNKSPT